MRKFLCLMAVALAAACSSSSSGGGGPGTSLSCYFPNEDCSLVNKASGFTSADVALLQQQCTQGGGMVGTSCSTVGAVDGYCFYSDFEALSGLPVSGATMNEYYYTASWTEANAQLSCALSGGTWSGAAVCGDGAITGAEACDGANLGGETCLSLGYTGGTLSCAPGCLSFDTSACTGTGPVCGDGAITGTEDCDGANLGGETCLTLGFTGGTLSCTSCTFDTSACTGAWTCNPAYYGTSDGCDCGCGILDPDCVDATVASCDWCDDVGGCSTTCGDINPTNNATCIASVCGDGAITGAEDCDGANLGGETCLSLGFTGGSLSCTNCAFDTSACTGTGWTCNPAYYGTNDGCDCGCGILDPDCADATVASCVWCGDAGACSSDFTCSDINPANNATCIASVCGDGAITGSEACDGANLGGETCLSLGFTGGSLSCTNCAFNTSACTGGSSVTLSCTETANGFCEQLSGVIPAADITGFQSYCTGGGYVYSASACSTVGAVAGYCDVTSAVGTSYDYWLYFYTSNWTLANAQTVCTGSGGTWN